MAFTSGKAVAEDPYDEMMRRTVRRKVAWRTIPLLALAYFMANLERTNLGVAALGMNESLGLTSATYGLAAGLYFIGYFVFEIPSNMAMARFGARRWLARIAVSWGVVATATAAVQGPGSLYAMRILLGIAEAGLFPGVVLYFTLWFPPRDRAKMLALFTTGSALSGVLGPPLSGSILALWPHGLFGVEDWRILFIIEGFPSIVVGLLMWKMLVDSPDQATWLSAAEKAWLGRQLAAPPDPAQRHNPLRTLLDVRVLLLSLAYFAKNCGGYVLVFFMPLIIKELTTSNGADYSTLTISLLSAIPASVALVVAIAWAAHSDRAQERRLHAAIPLLVAAVGVVWAASTRNPVSLLAALTLATVGIGSMSGAFFQLPSAFLSGPGVAVGIAAINATGNLGGFVGPYLFGVLQNATDSFRVGNLGLSFVLVIGAGIVFLPVFGRKPATAADHTAAEAGREQPVRPTGSSASPPEG